MEEAIRKAAVLIEAMPYIQHFAGKPVVIKFGGNAMENEKVLDDVLEDVVFLAAVGIRTIVVHGGGPQISEAMQKAGLKPNFIQGHRVTDAETLKVVVRVLSEDVNAGICRRVEKFGGRAVSHLPGRPYAPARAQEADDGARRGRQGAEAGPGLRGRGDERRARGG